MRHIIALSGPIASGKSELAQRLADQHGVRLISTGDLIRQAKPDVPNERSAPQAAGEALDRATGGKWVANALSELADGSNQSNVVIDSIRIEAQVDALRLAFGTIVTHIHLTAADAELERRYLERPAQMREFNSYKEVRQSPTEGSVGSLAAIADVVVQTDRCDQDDVFVRAVAQLSLYPRAHFRSWTYSLVPSMAARGKETLQRILRPSTGFLCAWAGRMPGTRWPTRRGHSFICRPEPSAIRGPSSSSVLVRRLREGTHGGNPSLPG